MASLTMLCGALMCGITALDATWLKYWWADRALSPVERQVFYLNRLDDLSGVDMVDLPGLGHKYAVTRPQARVIAAAPQSFDIGLSMYRFINPGSQEVFGYTLCLAGTEQQLDQLFEVLRRERIRTSVGKELLKHLPIVSARGLALHANWFDTLVELPWSDKDLYVVVGQLAKLVEYGGWPPETEPASEAQLRQVWSAFRAWWNEHRGRLESKPGAKLRSSM